MNVKFFLYELWGWFIHHGIPLTALVLTAILIPRLGRLAMRMAERQLSKGEEATKTRLALIGALVYVVEAVAFFFIVMVGLTNLGVPAMGAALPATVVSAAIGFGAQNVIGDFLAGFFIISERQFGLGDYVSFDGPSSPVEGTVVAITLRATRLRTPSGEMVNVPNGTTGVITNFSQEWSRALVDIQIPMKRGESMAELTRSVEHAAQHAVRDPEVARDVTDQLDVLPAMSLVQPATAGQPWSVQFRITVDVNPARQWAVERAIRAAVANEFWERMQHAPAFGPSSSLSDATTSADSVSDNRDENAALTEQASGSEPKDDGPGAPSNHTFDPRHPGPRRDERGDIIDGEEDFDDSLVGAAFQRRDYDSKLQNILSIGGRTRVSTTLLFIALIFVGGLALASSNPEGGQAGLLNPARWQSTEQTTAPEETTPTETTPSVTETPTEEQPQYTEQPTDTTTDTSNQQTYEQTPQSDSSQQQSESSTQEQSTADNTQPSQ